MSAIWKFNPDIAADCRRALVVEMAKIFSTLPSREELLEGCKKCRENQIPIKGGNVENVVYDATALRMWVSYAKGDKEAYQRSYAFVDFKQVDANKDGTPDLSQ
jgi:hypothetical protein